jgi:hypothetical protein
MRCGFYLMMTEIRITFVTVSALDSFRPVFDLELSVWSNFEIADMDFWRSEAYMKYFDYLDSKGGFYYEVCISLSHSVLPNIVFSDGEMHPYIH